MKGLTANVTLWVLFIILAGCSNGDTLTTPSVERDVLDFPPYSIEIFGQASAGEFEGYFHDVDIADVQSIPWYQEPTDPTECLAVTLSRQDNTPDNPFKPVFRWLVSMVEEGSDIQYVADRDYEDPDNDADYRTVACDATVFNGSIISTWDPELSTVFIETTVCYQVKDIEGQSSNDDWDIGLTILQWTEEDVEDFQENEPSARYDMMLPGSTSDSYDEYNPDICYDPEDGDIYIVYSAQQPTITDVYLKYCRLDRLTGLISLSRLAQTANHNGYDPSIDIGLVDVGLPQEINGVVVAYTSQYKAPPGGVTHNGYHLCVTSWPASYPDMNYNTTLDLMNPNHMYKDAGLSCIDIAPNTNAEHIVGLTYTQVTGSDGFGPITRIMGVSFSGGSVGTHLPIDEALGDDDEYDDGMYSAISINIQEDEEDPIYASITFMAQDYNADTLHPRAAFVRVDTPSIYWNKWVDADITITGNYNISDIPFINPGVSTAIAQEEDCYWAAWCDRIEMEPPPQEVWASYGYAGS